MAQDRGHGPVEASPKPNPYRRALLRQERSLNTRREIVRAATRLWSEKGYAETTVEEICAAAGVGRSTYYLHFESKERPLLELALTTARGVGADVEAAIEGGTFDDELTAFVAGLVRRMESTPRSLVVVVMRQVSMGNVGPRESTKDEVLFDDVLARIVGDGQRRGEIRLDVDARQVGEVLSGMTLDALQRWASGDPDRPLRDSLEFRLGLVLSAIRT